MSTKANSLPVAVRPVASFPWRWIALALALAAAITMAALGLLGSSGQPASGPAKAPGQVVQPAGGIVGPAQPVIVGGAVCAQCR